MEIKIHRGLEQIGGCITEIRTNTSRVFIDFGQNLPGIGEKTSREEDAAFVAKILSENTRQHEAVFYSHIHEDHIGLFPFIPRDIPQYMGEGAKELLRIKYYWLQEGNRLSYKKSESAEDFEKLRDGKRKKICINHFKTWKRTLPGDKPKSIQIGDIKITPFFTCHSVYDAYMFLIEADGKRIWHTGDFRKHGYFGKGLFPTLQKYATNIDVLITEGTMLNRDFECEHESKVSYDMSKAMNEYKYVFVLASATDIERLAAINTAAKQAQMDLYVCSNFFKESMELYTKRESAMSKGLFDFHPKIFRGKYVLDMQYQGFVMVVGSSQLEAVKNISKHFPADETLLIYSTWDGYYKIEEQLIANPKYKNFREAFANVVDIHTSGHADRNTLKKVIEIVNPTTEIIGIHKEAEASLRNLELSEEIKQKITE